MDEAGAINKIRELNGDTQFQKIRAKYDAIDFLKIFSISRNETAHSSFLAWLLRGNDIVSATEKPIVKFLEILEKRSSEQDGSDYLMDIKLRNAILTGSLKLENLSVETEKSVSSLKKCPEELKKCTDRIDIYITADIKLGNSEQKISIVIENKVGCNEGDIKKDDKKDLPKEYKEASQTQRYYLATKPGALNKKNGLESYNPSDHTHYLYVYLSPISDNKLRNREQLTEKEIPNCKYYIQINFQDISDSLITYFIDSSQNSHETEVILRNYQRTLTNPVDMESFNVIMAITPEDKTLVSDILEKYKELFYTASPLTSNKLKDVAIMKEFFKNNRTVIYYLLNTAVNFIESADESLMKLEKAYSRRKRDIYFLQTKQLGFVTATNHTDLIETIVKDLDANGMKLDQIKELLNNHKIKSILDSAKTTRMVNGKSIKCSRQVKGVSGTVYNVNNQWTDRVIKTAIESLIPAEYEIEILPRDKHS